MTEKRKTGGKPLYNEPTVFLGSIRVPASKKDEIRKMVYDYIKKFEK